MGFHCRSRILLLVSLFVGGMAGMGRAQDAFSLDPILPQDPAMRGEIDARAVPSHVQVAPGQTGHVAVDLSVPEGWVFYSPDPGPDVKPGELRVEAPGLNVGPVLWPRDKAKAEDLPDGTQIVNNVYEGRVLIYVPFEVSDDASAGEVSMRIEVVGQICEEVCVDLRDVSATATFEVGPQTRANPVWEADSAYAAGLESSVPAERLAETRTDASTDQRVMVVDSQDYSIWAGVALAMLAGLTLNIMPCVLPVIPLRILSIVQTAGESRRRFVTMGLAFAAGIMVFFVGIACVNVVVRLVTSQSLQLSAHFQYPSVRIVLAMIVIALSANLFGAFNVTVPSSIASLGGSGGSGHLATFGMGFMMAVLATPCSIAYLAGALAWAQTQPIWLGTLVFLLIGAGMAAPHVLLCAFPGLVQRLPKPGRWMELFKQTMGFLLLPAALWLLSTLSDDAYPFLVAGFGVALAFGLWVWGTWVRYDAPLGRKVIVRGLAVGLVAGVGLFALPRDDPEETVRFAPFDAQRISSAREDGHTVVLKFTAAWCTECKIIEYTVYRDPMVAEAFEQRDIVAIKGDVTDRSMPASELLRQRYGGAPPVTVVYPPGQGAEIILVGRYGSQELLNALDAAAGG